MVFCQGDPQGSSRRAPSHRRSTEGPCSAHKFHSFPRIRANSMPGGSKKTFIGRSKCLLSTQAGLASAALQLPAQGCLGHRSGCRSSTVGTFSLSPLTCSGPRSARLSCPRTRPIHGWSTWGWPWRRHRVLGSAAEHLHSNTSLVPLPAYGVKIRGERRKELTPSSPSTRRS